MAVFFPIKSMMHSNLKRIILSNHMDKMFKDILFLAYIIQRGISENTKLTTANRAVTNLMNQKKKSHKSCSKNII